MACQVPSAHESAIEHTGARDHSTVAHLDGADIVTQLVEHAFQVSQAPRIGSAARLLLADLAKELASAQVEDLAGAKHFRVIGGVAHQHLRT
jgi:hypothetical protein